jgi:DNA-binding response OmpR family regulator
MPDQEQSTKTILLVEDDVFLRNLLLTRFGREGLRVELAVDGIEAIEKMRSVQPGLVLLDLILPRKNGFEVLQEIADDPQLAKIPVIILSNLGQDSDVTRGKSLGAIDYYVKARLSIDELITKIKELISAT